MARNWLKLILIDGDGDRRARWESMAKGIGVAYRASATVMGCADFNRDREQVLVVQIAESSRATIHAVRAAFPRARVIVSAVDASQISAIEAFRSGADDFIPIDADDAEHAALLTRHLARADADPKDEEIPCGLVGDSAPMRRLRAFIKRLAPSSATVLITGETGTGKDCAAVLLHRMSGRARGPLVAFSCAAIPEGLLEGELFGYERGAFSGALAAYPGKLKLADGGTLLLDEIGELSLAGQAKVLRAIETREVYRLGGRTPTHFDVRIIAATNRDLKDEMLAGRFREDLFYRLAVAQLWIPPLRERREDVGPIARYLLKELAASAGRDGLRIDDAAMAVLEVHDWPGNGRELRNALEVAMVNADGDRIWPRDLLPSVASKAASAASAATPIDERTRILDALARNGGNKSLAARALNCSRMTVYRKLARFG